MWTINAKSHAIPHCRATMPAAHLTPSSLLIDATAAIHGVYKRQNTSNENAAADDKEAVSRAVEPNKMVNVETTLSFAIKPQIREEETLQSPNPSGLKTGEINPAIPARILSLESVTTFSLKSKVCKNQITTVATKIIVKAFCRKSFAFSHKRCTTFFRAGIR